MITKERLEELIEKGATIYIICWGKIKEVFLDDVIFMDIEDDKLCYEIEGDLPRTTDLNHLFETHIDAEFASKYQNISRIDYLNLPTYEEFIKNYQSFGDDLIPDEKCVIFTCKDGVYSLYACDNEIWVGKDSDGSVMCHKELNKENYIRACDICVKLFKGE